MWAEEEERKKTNWSGWKNEMKIGRQQNWQNNRKGNCGILWWKRFGSFFEFPTFPWVGFAAAFLWGTSFYVWKGWMGWLLFWPFPPSAHRTFSFGVPSIGGMEFLLIRPGGAEGPPSQQQQEQANFRNWLLGFSASSCPNVLLLRVGIFLQCLLVPSPFLANLRPTLPPLLIPQRRQNFYSLN